MNWLLSNKYTCLEFEDFFSNFTLTHTLTCAISEWSIHSIYFVERWKNIRISRRNYVTNLELCVNWHYTFKVYRTQTKRPMNGNWDPRFNSRFFILSICLFFFHCRQNQITSRTLFKRWKRWNKLCFDKDTKIQMKAIGVNWFLSWLEAIESILELISLYSKSCEKCCLK